MSVNLPNRTTLLLTSIAAACVLSACGGNDNNTPSAATQTFTGAVAAAGFVPGNTSGNPTLKAGYYAGATVCVDANGNGKCDTTETSTTTDSSGHFTLKTSGTGQLLADV